MNVYIVYDLDSGEIFDTTTPDLFTDESYRVVEAGEALPEYNLSDYKYEN